MPVRCDLNDRCQFSATLKILCPSKHLTILQLLILTSSKGSSKCPANRQRRRLGLVKSSYKSRQGCPSSISRRCVNYIVTIAAFINYIYSVQPTSPSIKTARYWPLCVEKPAPAHGVDSHGISVCCCSAQCCAACLASRTRRPLPCLSCLVAAQSYEPHPKI